jgi:hypothetical protein
MRVKKFFNPPDAETLSLYNVGDLNKQDLVFAKNPPDSSQAGGFFMAMAE